MIFIFLSSCGLAGSFSNPNIPSVFPNEKSCGNPIVSPTTPSIISTAKKKEKNFFSGQLNFTIHTLFFFGIWDAGYFELYSPTCC
jgi:hypothetical protein